MSREFEVAVDGVMEIEADSPKEAEEKAMTASLFDLEITKTEVINR